MSLLVVGSVAFDTVKTPFGEADEVLGGSATYFSTAASYFTDVSLVAVVGEDFPEKHVTFLKSRKVDVAGLTRAPGKTFRWRGEYGYDLNEAKTLETALNVFESFRPVVPEQYKSSDVVFLANIDPVLQREVLHQIEKPKLVACDTMNFWIEGKKDELIKTLAEVDILLINEASGASTARSCSGTAGYSPRRHTRWRRYSTRRVRATASRAGSWATWTTCRTSATILCGRL
jgi:hypothetical protein